MRDRVRDRFSTCAIMCVLATTVAGALLCAGVVSAQGELTMLEDSGEEAYAIAGSLKVGDPAALDVRVVFDYQDDQNCYELHLTSASVTLQRIVSGESTHIGRCQPPSDLEAGQELPLTVRHEGWRITFILGNEVLVRAFDSALSEGQVGYAAAGGEITELMIQPLGDVFLTDDFVREEDAQSAWESAAGAWKTQSLRVDEQSERMEADKSTNAFSFWGRGKDGALAVTGYWFWNNYSVRSGVRPAGTDAMGLVAYYQDPESYLCVRWTSALAETEDANQLQVIQVADGEQTILAQVPGGHLPEHWYSMQLNVCDELVQCFIDAELRLSARLQPFGQGQPGLYCQGSAGTFFDSVAIQSWEALSETFDAPNPGKWAAISGTWQHDANGYLRAEGNGERVCVTGQPDWGAHVYAADLFSSAGGGVGLIACQSEDEGAYILLRIGPSGRGTSYAGKAQLIKHTSEGQQVLVEAPASMKPKSWHRAKLVVDDGLIKGYLDGKRILDAYADGQGAALFDNVYFLLLPAKRTTRLAKEFTEGDAHPEMAEWASTRAPWIKPESEGAGATWWTKGDYYGDKTVTFAIPSVGSASGTVRLWLDASPGSDKTGFSLIIEATKGSKTLKAKLLQGEETLDAAEIETESNPCPVSFERKGSFVVVMAEGRVVFKRGQ